MPRVIKSSILAAALCAASALASAAEKVTVLLDWFVNPDHAALIVAKQKGFFAKHDLDVTFIEPADPSMPPKLLAAGQGDLAVDYQPQLQMAVAEGLPIKRIGTLISTPLNTLMVLKDSGINDIAALKGKTIGYSVSGFEQSILGAMLATAGLSKEDVTWVNVNFSLAPSLLAGQVDAVFGGYRNFELNTLDLEGRPGLAFYPEEHGVPSYDELVLIANAERVDDPRFDRFLTALEEATVYTLNHPDEAWTAFQAYKPNDLDNELNRRAWRDTLPRLALRPRALDNHSYTRMAEFLHKNGMIDAVQPLADYAVQLPRE